MDNGFDGFDDDSDGDTSNRSSNPGLDALQEIERELQSFERSLKVVSDNASGQRHSDAKGIPGTTDLPGIGPRSPRPKNGFIKAGTVRPTRSSLERSKAAGNITGSRSNAARDRGDGSPNPSTPGDAKQLVDDGGRVPRPPRQDPRRAGLGNRSRTILVDRKGGRNTSKFTNPVFNSAEFCASVKEIKFNTQGEGVLSIVIPYEFRGSAKEFVDAYGLELEFVVKKKIY